MAFSVIRTLQIHDKFELTEDGVPKLISSETIQIGEATVLGHDSVPDAEIEVKLDEYRITATNVRYGIITLGADSPWTRCLQENQQINVRIELQDETVLESTAKVHSTVKGRIDRLSRLFHANEDQLKNRLFEVSIKDEAGMTLLLKEIVEE